MCVRACMRVRVHVCVRAHMSEFVCTCVLKICDNIDTAIYQYSD